MQMTAPEALDVGREPDPVRRLYGLDNPKCAHFAKQCLMARRLVERGVRFVQIYSGGMENERSWDGHTDLAANQVVNCMAQGECGDTTDRWKRVVDAPGTVATSISPDCVGGWNECSKQGEGASIWAYDDSRVVQWNADGNQYGCWE